MEQQPKELMEKIISLAKRRGFIYQGSEVYGGLAGTWDYGPLGVSLKNNIKHLWWKKFVDDRQDMYGIDAAILMHPGVWKASGHVDTFTDPLVECTKCKKRFRADQLENAGVCDACGEPTGEARNFNMMFQTQVGAVEDSSATVYLRPETAQGMFVNFKNVVDSFHPKLPFGTAQIGKAFRNEITPRDFIFRVREFEQMEIEYFIRESDWKTQFEYWKNEMKDWIEMIGIDTAKTHELEVGEEDLAHYSKRTVDFEFDFPFGKKELYGIAYRTNFDLTNHNLTYQDEETQEKIVPHVIEPTFGLDRTILAVLCSVYREEHTEGEVRSFLSFKPSVAPVICAVSPLLKNKPELVEKSQEVFKMLKKRFGQVMFDDNGNIGKRYRRQDEIGTPWCVVVDFDTLGENQELLDTVTIRDRDTGAQTRLPITELESYISEKLA
ncbi:glycine--tRNA ligase [Candidatus Nomurabacteria bacterium]|nr:glycine--tRNA ligase [Candidatus Nomurabacteria bacterium]